MRPNGSRLSCGANAVGRKHPALRYELVGAQRYGSSEGRPRQLQALVRPHASLSLPRVIRRIDVGYTPGANAVRLDDRLALSPIKMASAPRDDDETAGRHRFGCLQVELVAPTDVKRAGDHGEVPVGWVDVWGNVVPVGYLQAIRERHVGHGSIALEGRALGRSEEHTSELQSQSNLVCRLLLEKKKQQ